MKRVFADDTLTVAPAVAVAAFLAGHPALRAYRVPFSVGILVLVAVLSTALSFVLSRVLRRPAAVSYVASAAGLIVFLVAMTGPHPAELARQLAQGPSRIVSETLPLSGSPGSLAILVVLVWLCGAATSELLIRSGTHGGAAMFIPAALFVLTFAASASAPGRDEASGPLLLAVLASIALVRHHHASHVTAVTTDDSAARPPRYRASLLGAGSVAAVATILGFAVPALPAMSRPPATLHRAAPTGSTLLVDPVDTMADLRDGNPHAPARTELTVELGQPAIGYLAVAVLDDYDGAVWRFDTTFQPTGGRIPLGPAATSVSTTPVRERITIDVPLPLPLLPAVDHPYRVGGVAVLADPPSGMLLPQSRIFTPVSYTVYSDAPDSTLAGLPAAFGLDTTVANPADDALPPNSTTDMAAALRFLSTVTRQRPAPTVAFLQSVLTALRTNDRRIDPSLPGSLPRPTSTTTVAPAAGSLGGVSLSEVINAVTINRAATPEQFATLFAMVARYLGVPARVVTGFRLASSATSATVPSGVHQVTDRQAWAWVEIPVSGLGWVLADPTPDAVTALSAPPPEQVQAPNTTLPSRQANAVPGNAINGGHALANPASVTRRHQHPVSPWVVALAGVAGFLLLVLLVVPGQAAVRRLWRRRYRRSQQPDELAVGAWLELLDGLDRAGMDPEAGWTSTEVATEAGLHFGREVEEAVRSVGTVADRAVFSTSHQIAHPIALHSWSTQLSAGRLALRTLDRRQRLRAMLSVGSSPRRPRT